MTEYQRGMKTSMLTHSSTLVVVFRSPVMGNGEENIATSDIRPPSIRSAPFIVSAGDVWSSIVSPSVAGVFMSFDYNTRSSSDSNSESKTATEIKF
jgi:hypothetical protein